MTVYCHPAYLTHMQSTSSEMPGWMNHKLKSRLPGEVWETMETVTETLFFLAFKITADSDCSHEIKRHLLLRRKAMTDLDSVLESRDIVLSTKVHLVKAMVFPLVMYGCESWTVKKS